MDPAASGRGFLIRAALPPSHLVPVKADSAQRASTDHNESALRLLSFQNSTLKTSPWFIMYSVCAIQEQQKILMTMLDLIFRRRLRSLFRFTYLHSDILLFKYHLLKTVSVLSWPAFALFSEISLFMVSFLNSTDFSSPLPAPHCEDYCMIVCALPVRDCGVPNFVPFSIWLVIPDLNFSK